MMVSIILIIKFALSDRQSTETGNFVSAFKFICYFYVKKTDIFSDLPYKYNRANA